MMKSVPIINAIAIGKAMKALGMKPAMIYATKLTPAAVRAYGNWVDTWVTWSHWAPALAMIVVSEIGEQWSPHTAPAMHALTQTTPRGSVSGNTPRVMGIKMPNVPQLVPVENDKPQAIKKMMAGRKVLNPPAEFLTSASTYCFAPRLSVIAFKLQANVRIRMAGTIERNPSGMQ